MSERPSDQDPALQTRAAIAERVGMQLGWLQEAAAIIGGPTATIERTFLPPVVEGDTARDDAAMPDWTPQQIEKVTAIGRRFGYGAQETVPSGLSGGVRVAEGGKAWKIVAETVAIEAEEDVHTIVFNGSPYRSLGEDELTFLKEKQAIELPPGAKEYDLALELAKRAAETIHDEPIVQAFGYEVAPDNAAVHEATGQLIEVGRSASGQSLQVLRVAGEQYTDTEEGEPKTKERYRPNTTRVMTLLAEKLAAEGNMNDPIAFGTSNTYASRVPATTEASFNLDPPRPLGVVMYGRKTLGDSGAPVPKELPLNHLPGDLRLMYDNLLRLAGLVGVEPPKPEYPQTSEHGLIQYEPNGPEFHIDT